MTSSTTNRSPRAALHAVVSGRVQGVGYRWFVAQRANRLGIGGYARNLPDGTVEVEAEGERTALEQLLEALAKGPVDAQVTSVVPSWSAHRSAYERFEMRR